MNAQMEQRKKMQEEADAKIKALESKLEADRLKNEAKIKDMESNLANAAESEKEAQMAALDKAKAA
jgi:Spy/CpxP family protein refolding chaperone